MSISALWINGTMDSQSIIDEQSDLDTLWNTEESNNSDRLLAFLLLFPFILLSFPFILLSFPFILFTLSFYSFYPILFEWQCQLLRLKYQKMSKYKKTDPLFYTSQRSNASGFVSLVLLYATDLWNQYLL